MEFKNIMVPYDGSAYSTRALEAAKYIASLVDGAEIHVVKVIGPGSAESGMGDVDTYKNLLEKLELAAQAVLAKEVEDAVGTTDGLKIEAVASNSPLEGVMRYIRNENVDLVVMGRSGGGVIHTLLGSVSTGVLHEAEVPVLTVK